MLSGDGVSFSLCLDGRMVSRVWAIRLPMVTDSLYSVWCVSRLLSGTPTQALLGFPEFLDLVSVSVRTYSISC
jgi:hypothetical protein